MTDIAIYHMGREGSTWFCDYLMANFERNGIGVNCCWEYWAENRLYDDSTGLIAETEQLDLDWSIDNLDQDLMFNDKVSLLEKHASSTKMIRLTEHKGFTTKPFDYMLGRKMRWVTAIRKDVFSQMLSFAMASNTGRWHAWDADAVADNLGWYRENKVTISIKEAEEWFESYMVFKQRRKRLVESGSLIGQIAYETLDVDATRVVSDLLKSHGVDSPTIIPPSEFTVSTKRLTGNGDKVSMIANYDELAAWYKSSRWASV